MELSAQVSLGAPKSLGSPPAANACLCGVFGRHRSAHVRQGRSGAARTHLLCRLSRGKLDRANLVLGVEIKGDDLAKRLRHKR